MEFGREIGRRLGAGQRVEPDREGVRMGVIVSGTFEAEDGHCRTAVEAEQTVEVKAIGESVGVVDRDHEPAALGGDQPSSVRKRLPDLML